MEQVTVIPADLSTKMPHRYKIQRLHRLSIYIYYHGCVVLGLPQAGGGYSNFPWDNVNSVLDDKFLFTY